MNKKSHVILADYLSEGLEYPPGRFFLRFGSLLPDLIIYTFVHKHRFYSRKNEVFSLISSLEKSLPSPVFYIKLGYVLHYAADFFTAPHNEAARLSLKKHFAYENVLQKKLEEVCNSSCAQAVPVKNIPGFISRCHQEYKKQPFSVENDCRFILYVCSTIYFSLKK